MKKLPFVVKRQHNIENYIVDFYIAERKLVIETDGIQHTTKEHMQADRERDVALAKWNITVLRYSNELIRKSFYAVAEDIWLHLGIDFSDLGEVCDN